MGRREITGMKNGARRSRAAVAAMVMEAERKPVAGLDGFASGGRRSILLGKRAVAGILVAGFVDFDRAFEVGTVFDHDARRGEVAVDGTVFLDLDPVLGAKVALHSAVDHHFTGNDIGGYFRGGADGQLALVELDQSFD